MLLPQEINLTKCFFSEMRFLIGVVLWAFAYPAWVDAIKAYPHSLDYIDELGMRHEVYIRGDEWYHWSEDVNGKVIVKTNGTMCYGAETEDGSIVPIAGERGKLRGSRPPPQEAAEGRKQHAHAAAHRRSLNRRDRSLTHEKR